MKLKTLALCVLAAGFVSCGKPSVDKQLDNFEKAYKSKDCDKIRAAYAELIYSQAEAWVKSEYNGETDSKWATPEQEQRLEDIVDKYQDDCDCDFKSMSDEMLELFFQYIDEIEEQLKKEQKK